MLFFILCPYFRNLLKNQLTVGIEIGGFMTSLAVSMHSRVIVPQTVLIRGDVKTAKYGLEWLWNTEDRVFKSNNIDNFRVVEVKSIAIKLRHHLSEKTHDLDVKMSEVDIHPLLLTNEQKVTS